MEAEIEIEIGFGYGVRCCGGRSYEAYGLVGKSCRRGSQWNVANCDRGTRVLPAMEVWQVGK